ncbi:MAG: flagellin N-terminal helical domain-containing protein [Planctomycetota bacterium]|jgi:flagellin
MTRINTNVQSLVAQRALNVNNTSLNQALDRLSTGLRINSGRDDPAGLIASETLRSSMRAIDTAIDNANRADTIVAVAEGGLQEVSSLLLELENLVDQTANEAGLTDEEITANQLQIDSILGSINRLAEATAFGSKKLLNGNFDFTTSGVTSSEVTGIQINGAKIPNGAARQVNVTVQTPSETALLSTVLAGTDGSNALNGTLNGVTTFQVRGAYGSEILSFASGTTTAQIATAINASRELTGVSATASGAAGGASSLMLQSTDYGDDAFVSISVINNLSGFSSIDDPGLTSGSLAADTRTTGVDGTVIVNGANGIVKGQEVSVRSGALSMDLTLATSTINTANATTSFDITGGGALFSISPTVGLAGQETLGIGEVSTAKLGNSGTGFLATLGSGETNDLSSKNFTSAQRVIRTAIDQVASLRGRLGGFQKNTLRTTINSLRVSLENVTAAESAIRDADFAEETSALTRAQILVNSSTATLQLANASPQSVLALIG